MKKSFLCFLIGSIVLGFVSAQIVYSRYMSNLESIKMNAYLLQIGSYESIEKVSLDLKDDFYYLILNEDNFYNAYVGVTTNLFNASKIKDIYEEKKYSIDIKPVVINNVEFISNLEEFDKLITEVDSSSNVLSIMEVVLSNYEELVLGK